MLSAPAGLWAGGLGTGPNHTHILPLPCGLCFLELVSTGSFRHGWPNGIPGAATAPKGEQVELRGDCMINASVRLQEEGGG